MGRSYVQRRSQLAAVKQQAREAVEAASNAGRVVEELVTTREPGTCAMCGRKTRLQVCARANCQTEYERLYQADRRERRYALRGAK